MLVSPTSLLWNFSKYKSMLQHSHMWHNILGPMFQSNNTMSSQTIHILHRTQHMVMVYIFLRKYSQPQNILCIKYTYQIKKRYSSPQNRSRRPTRSGEILLSILGARLGWVVNATLQQETDPIPIVQDSNPGPPTMCCKSLYRLRCLGPYIHIR